VATMSADFEHFSDDDELWMSDLETRAIDLENELSVWREARGRAPTDQEYAQEPVSSPPHRSFRRAAGRPQASPREPARTATRRASRSQARTADMPTEDARTRALIDYGRRSARRSRFGHVRRLTIGLIVAGIGVALLIVVVLRPGASWPPSVTLVKSEITTACQNPNVSSEPNQVNFACAQATSQILWVFSLMTSGDNANFDDAKSGRQGLEPISPAQGGAVAWSLNLHHPYNADSPIDSLAVAARAINNIIGGASVTGSNGKPTVQAGLESNPANCLKYTGSAAVITRSGYPDLCASPISSPAGQAALVADVYQQWFVGASATVAQEASVLFQHAGDPENPQVQAILKSLFGPTA
jgi:hypothetical protein